ncbi:MAG: phosphoribosylglycinamide formyltransferase, partial [Lachnospiraceae bacterium]|nr:phosphoribosylglycinamide formyltransferase [Lachnospiraceae bacterium]
RALFNLSLLDAMKACEPDLIVLAGFLVNVPVEIIREFKNRIINIHPSLIPSFCGKGFYGIKVHEEALKKGVKVSGATVHFVDEGIDTGRIIDQKAVYVQEGDTPKTLQERIMEQAEWVILPRTIQRIAKGEIKIGEN